MAKALIQRVQERLGWISEHLAWLPACAARWTVGWVFVQSGWGKLHNMEQIVGFFRDLGIPAPELQAPFVAALELVGGGMLLLGLGTRAMAVPLMGTMVVAIATARRKELESLGDLFGFVEWLYLLLLLYLAVMGPGKLALDAWVARATRTAPSR